MKTIYKDLYPIKKKRKKKAFLYKEENVRRCYRPRCWLNSTFLMHFWTPEVVFHVSRISTSIILPRASIYFEDMSDQSTLSFAALVGHCTD